MSQWVRSVTIAHSPNKCCQSMCQPMITRFMVQPNASNDLVHLSCSLISYRSVQGLILILPITLSIYFTDFPPIPVNHQVDQRSHEKGIMLILVVLSTYLTCYHANPLVDKSVSRTHDKRIVTIHS
jgi:hypothetical protein